MTDADTEQEKKIFVARQPIFDRDKKIYGYELLFRRGLENFFDESLDKNVASSKVLLDTFMLFDLKELTRGKRAFLNFTAPVLLSNLALAFKTDSIVIELLENIQPKPNIIKACKKLKSKGYTLALDDFEYNPHYQPLIDLADIIKIDFLTTQGEERQQIIEKSRKKHIKFLAEKVETIEQYNHGREIGYDYFQGYYFSKPVIVSTRDAPSYKVNLLQIFKEIYQPDTSVARLEEIIKRDVPLVYKLLRFINSAAFGLRSEVRSIRHALSLLGTIEFKKWMSMMLLSQLSSGKPDELMINSLTRAKFCELTAESIGQKHRQSDFFLTGLFSLIDAFLDRPMTDILAELPISMDIKNAVQEQKGHPGQVLRLIINYEQSKWNIVSEISQSLDIDENKILNHYFNSIKWANNPSARGAIEGANAPSKGFLT